MGIDILAQWTLWEKTFWHSVHYGSIHFGTVDISGVDILGIYKTARIHDIWSKTISSKRRLVECDIWSIRRFADYDVSLTTTIGRKFVELRRNLVEIWSKTDSYRKNKNCLHLRFLHLQYIFTPVSVLVSLTFVY